MNIPIIVVACLIVVALIVSVRYVIVWRRILHREEADLDRRRKYLDKMRLGLEDYGRRLSDWHRELRIARTGLNNLVTHAENYRGDHPATVILFEKVVQRAEKELKELEGLDEGAE